MREGKGRKKEWEERERVRIDRMKEHKTGSERMRDM